MQLIYFLSGTRALFFVFTLFHFQAESAGKLIFLEEGPVFTSYVPGSAIHEESLH